MTLNVVDIFCGAGGLSKGFQLARVDDVGDDAGFKVVYGIDKDPDCMRTYRRNHFKDVDEDRLASIAVCDSTANLTGEVILTATGLDQIDVVIGGPNCQGVSSAGLRNAGDERNERFREFLNLVSELRPQWFLMENVPGLAHANNRDLLQTILTDFAALPGYEVAADVLLASDFGCAQLRYRLFIVGTRTGHPIRFPQPQYARPSVAGSPTPLFQAHLPRCKTVEDAIGYLKPYPAGVAVEGEPPEIECPDGKRLRIRNHVVPAMSEENLLRIQAVEPGQDWRSIPVGLLPERCFSTRASDQKGAYGRLSWDHPAFTIISLAGNVSSGPYTHPEYHRPISVREAADLQGFPQDFVFDGDVASAYRQVGNAVPPPLAQAMARMILFCHYRPDEAETEGAKGRITPDLFQRVEKGEAFPVLTPRHLLTKPIANAHHGQAGQVHREAVASTFTFVEDPKVAGREVPNVDLSRIYIEAQLPRNMRVGKRARAIVGYVEGKTLDELRLEARVSATSIKKWVTGFFESGSDGWRAYHTPLAALAGGDEVLLAKLEMAVTQVRSYDVREDSTESGKDGDDVESRPHMNRYLRSLIKRFKHESVEDLAERVGARLGRGVGTVYVGDLLALCDAILEPSADVPGSIGMPVSAAK